MDTIREYCLTLSKGVILLLALVQLFSMVDYVRYHNLTAMRIRQAGSRGHHTGQHRAAHPGTRGIKTTVTPSTHGVLTLIDPHDLMSGNRTSATTAPPVNDTIKFTVSVGHKMASAETTPPRIMNSTIQTFNRSVILQTTPPGGVKTNNKTAPPGGDKRSNKTAPPGDIKWKHQTKAPVSNKYTFAFKDIDNRRPFSYKGGDVMVQIHIPKTGGSTFEAHLLTVGQCLRDTDTTCHYKKMKKGWLLSA